MCRYFVSTVHAGTSYAGLWFSEPQFYVRTSYLQESFYSVGLTIRLQNAPYRNHCMVLLMLKYAIISHTPHDFVLRFH